MTDLPFNLYKSWRTWIISFLARQTQYKNGFYSELTIFHTIFLFIHSVYGCVCVFSRLFLCVYVRFKPGVFRIHRIRIVLKKCLYPNAVIQIILLLLKWRISWLRIVLYKSCHHHDPGIFISRSFVCCCLFACSFVHRSYIYVARLVYELKRLCIYMQLFRI